VVGQRCGERDQRGVDQGGVLGAAAPFDPGAAGAVVVDAEEPVEVGGAFFAVELSFLTPGVAVGVDGGDQVGAELAQVGGVEALGLGEHRLDAAGPDLGVAGEAVDGAFDDLGLGE
jgi:hypothetical protein